MLYVQIKNINSKNNIIELPVREADPEPINLEKIRKEIYKEPKDAYIEENPFKVYTHVNGVDFNITMEEAEKIIQADKQEYEIPLKITIPEKTYTQARIYVSFFLFLIIYNIIISKIGI